MIESHNTHSAELCVTVTGSGFDLLGLDDLPLCPEVLFCCCGGSGPELVGGLRLNGMLP